MLQGDPSTAPFCCICTDNYLRVPSTFKCQTLLNTAWVPLQGDPSAVPYAVENVREVIGKKPVFGICMGHQLLGQAFGGTTFKLKFGHHGGNHPIRFEETSKSHGVAHISLQPSNCSSASFQAFGKLRTTSHGYAEALGDMAIVQEGPCKPPGEQPAPRAAL